jgi:hypothetical protein
MIAYLVINKPKDNIFLPFAEQYKVFENRESALAWAVACGMRDDYGMGVTDKVGVMTVYKAGAVDVALMPLEIIDTK